MKIYQYDNIKDANKTLFNFLKNSVPVSHVAVASVKDVPNFFIFADVKVAEKPKAKLPKKEKKTEAKATVAKTEPSKEKKPEAKLNE